MLRIMAHAHMLGRPSLMWRGEAVPFCLLFVCSRRHALVKVLTGFAGLDVAITSDKQRWREDGACGKCLDYEEGWHICERDFVGSCSSNVLAQSTTDERGRV